MTTVGRTLDRNLVQRRRDPAERQQPLPRRPARLRPELQLAGPQPARPAGVTGAYIAGLLRDRLAGHLPPAGGQPLGRAPRRRAGHPEPLRRPFVGLLRPADQRDPDASSTISPDGSGPPRRSRSSSRAQQIATPTQGAAAPRPRPHRDAATPKGSNRPPRRPRCRPTTTTTTQPCGLLGVLLGCRVGLRPRRRSSAELAVSSRRLGGLLSNKVTATPDATQATLCRATPSHAQPSRPPDPDRARRLPAAAAAAGAATRAPRRTAGLSPSGRTTSGVGSDASRRRLVAASPRSLLVALVLALAGCSVPAGGTSQRTATAVFSDVGDLANGAQVQLADVPVGTVSSIALDGDKAKVTLDLRQRRAHPGQRARPPSIARPSSATSSSSSTCPRTRSGRRAATAPQLADGAVIHHTTARARCRAVRRRPGRRCSAPSPPPSSNRSSPPAGRASLARKPRSSRCSPTSPTVDHGYAQHTDEITSAVNGLNKPDVVPGADQRRHARPR